MNMDNLDIMNGREPSNKEIYAISEYFNCVQLKYLNYIKIIVLSILVIALILQINAIQNSFNLYARQIFILYIIISLIILIIYSIAFKKNEPKQVKEIKKGNCYLFDCICTEANTINSFWENKYQIVLTLSDKYKMPDNYVIKPSELNKSLNINKAADLVGRKILVCFFPNIKYAKAFVRDVPLKNSECIN